MIATVLRRSAFVGRLRFLIFQRHYNQIVRYGLPLLAIALTLLTALLMREYREWRINTVILGWSPVIVVGAIAVLTIVYTRTETMALLVIMTSTLVADGIGTGTGTKLTFTLLLLLLWLGIWLFRQFVIERKLSFRPAYPNWPILLFIISVIASMIWSTMYVDTRVEALFNDKFMPRLLTALVMIVSPLSLILYASIVRSERMVRLIVGWFVIAGGLYVVMRIGLGYVPPPLNDRGQFAVWVATLTAGQALFNSSLKLQWRLLLGGIALGWAYVTIGLGFSWLSGWVPLAISFLLLMAFFSRRLLVVCSIVLLIVLAQNWPAIDTALNAESEESGTTRLEAYELTLSRWRPHWLLGTGPAGYHFYNTAYKVYVVGVTNLSHNNYIDILAQTGVVGFTAWVLLWGGQGLMIYKLLRERAPTPFLRGVKYSLVAMYPCILALQMLGDWITPFTYTQTLAGIDYTIWAWIFSGLAIAVYYICKEANERPVETIIVTQEHALLVEGTRQS